MLEVIFSSATHKRDGVGMVGIMLVAKPEACSEAFCDDFLKGFPEGDARITVEENKAVLTANSLIKRLEIDLSEDEIKGLSTLLGGDLNIFPIEKCITAGFQIIKKDMKDDCKWGNERDVEYIYRTFRHK